MTTSYLTHVKPHQGKTCYFAIKPTVREVVNPAQLCQMLELDFCESVSSGPPMSQDDKRFLSTIEQIAFQVEDGHYVMPLPFRYATPHLPNNGFVALNRLSKLQTRLDHDEKYQRDYNAFMTGLFEKLCRKDPRIWQGLVYSAPRSIPSPKAKQNTGRV